MVHIRILNEERERERELTQNRSAVGKKVVQSREAVVYIYIIYIMSPVRAEMRETALLSKGIVGEAKEVHHSHVH